MEKVGWDNECIIRHFDSATLIHHPMIRSVHAAKERWWRIAKKTKEKKKTPALREMAKERLLPQGISFSDAMLERIWFQGVRCCFSKTTCGGACIPYVLFCCSSTLFISIQCSYFIITYIYNWRFWKYYLHEKNTVPIKVIL